VIDDVEAVGDLDGEASVGDPCRIPVTHLLQLAAFFFW